MSVLEKAQKAVEFLKHNVDEKKIAEIQQQCVLLGQSMGAMGHHPSLTPTYTSLLQDSIPILLGLCTHHTSELRLVGDETLNRLIVGGMPFLASKVHLYLHNNIIPTKDPRWLRAAISRICLGKSWLRAGMGRGRLFAQSIVQKFREILQRLQTPEVIGDKGDQLLMECFETNLPRILNALSPYMTKDEMLVLVNSFIPYVTSTTASIRRSTSSCIAELCGYHQQKLINHALCEAIDALSSENASQNGILGWLGTLRALFSSQTLKSLPQDVVSLDKYMQVYRVCLHHLSNKGNDHNTYNAAMEVLVVLLTDPSAVFRRELLNTAGPQSLFNTAVDKSRRTHQRSLSSASMVQSVMSTISSSSVNLYEDCGLLSETSEPLTFHGALMLGGLSQHHTPYRSMEDLGSRGVGTPESPCEPVINDVHPEEALSPDQLSSYVTEKLTMGSEEEGLGHQHMDREDDEHSYITHSTHIVKINIGSFYDADVPLKYCGRLLISKFLLSGVSGQCVSERNVRVSVKASAISCLSCILAIYPDCLTMYLDKDFLHNQSGNSEFSNMSHNEQLNDFVLERNVCYQESMSDSYGQELLSKSVDLMSQVSNHSMSQRATSSSQRIKDKYRIQESVDGSLAGIPSAMLDSKQQSTNMAVSGVSDCTNQGMSTSNFTMASNMTASNDPLSTDFLMTTSVDPLTSSLDLEMKFDHFGESSITDGAEPNLDRNNFQDMFLKHDGQTVVERQISNESKSDEIDEGKPARRELRKPSSEKSGSVLETVEESSRNDSSQSEQDSAINKNSNVEINNSCLNEDGGPQLMSEVISLYEAHSDPQIRGLIRVCIGNYVNAVLNLAAGDYYKWKALSSTSKEIPECLHVQNLINLMLKGLSDEIHSSVNHSLTALSRCTHSLALSNHYMLLPHVFNSLRVVEDNPYWLCKVSLCKFYEKLPLQILRIILPDWVKRSEIVLNIMIGYLGEQDQRVRSAAIETIFRFTYFLSPPVGSDHTNLLTSLAGSYTDTLLLNALQGTIDPLHEFKELFVKGDLPGPLKFLQKDSSSNEDSRAIEESETLNNNLKTIISVLSFKLMESSCKYFTQGCLEMLLRLSQEFPPTKHPLAYIGLGLLDTSIHLLENRTLSVSCTQVLVEFVTQIYSIAAWNTLSQSADPPSELLPPLSLPSPPMDPLWQHFPPGCGFSQRSESLLRVTLKLLNMLVHILEDVTPVALMIHQKTPSIIPPSPIRRRPGETPKKGSSLGGGDSPLVEDKGITLRKRHPYNPTNPTTTSSLPIGYFASDSTLLKLYINLRAAYSTHKVTLDPASSIFLKFMSATLSSVAIQLEFVSEKEAGLIAEELLFYIKTLLPLNPDNAVFCVTQILKCLSSTNTTAFRSDLNEYFNKSNVSDTLARWEKMNDKQRFKQTFYSDVLLCKYDDLDKDYGSLRDCNIDLERRSSTDSSKSAILNNHLKSEKECFNNILVLSKCKTDKKWNANKKDLEKYLRLIEPAVIQALKNYTMQNNIPLQCRVLELLNQLLSLRVNYFLLDSDQVFIGFVLKQLENIENHEILNTGELVGSIFKFLVHLSSIKHNHQNKQLMDIPKLIQLCDGLLASGVHWECVEAMHPVTYKVFVPTPITPQSRAQAQEAQVAKEVLFAMRHKIMHDPKVLRLISSILVLCGEHGEAHFHWSSVALDSLLQLLRQGTVCLDSPHSMASAHCLMRSLHPHLIYHQGRLDSVIVIMFDRPPPQETSTMETKQRWLATILLLLQNVVSKYPENEILLSLNMLKASHISPAAIFFNMDNEIDPLNAQNVNENCANLSPDVIFVRFLFRVVTYALNELKGCDGSDLKEDGGMSYWCSLTASLICHMKHILYLKDGCRFPLLAKTAQNVLHSEQSGLNTGLYEPEENIPLVDLMGICNSVWWWQPLLTVHWCHLVIRLRFLEQKYWPTLFGFLQNAPSPRDLPSCNRNLHEEMLQVGCMMTLCEHFVDNGLEEVVYLTWLLVNRIHLIVKYSDESVVSQLLAKVNSVSSASGLLLQAVAARCHNVKGSFGTKVCNILSSCHPSQSGSLVVYICRTVGGLSPANSHSFARLAITRCRHLMSLSPEEVGEQLVKEDLQIVLDALHQDQVHLRHPQLVEELNMLASTYFDLSPLVLTQDRPINPQYIKTTNIDTGWLLKQIKNRCYANPNEPPVFGKLTSQAKLLQSLDLDQLNTVVNCPEFDRQILSQMLKIAVKNYIKKLVDEAIEWDSIKRERNHNYFTNNPNYYTSYAMRNEQRSQFYVSVKDLQESIEPTIRFGKLKLDTKEEPLEIVPPAFDNYLTVALTQCEKAVQSLVSLFPRQSRPLSQFDTGTFLENQTMDKYTRRCFQVFRDKQFHQELLDVQNILKAYLESYQMLEVILKDIDFDVRDKILESFLTKSLAKSLMSFNVIALQYTSYLINMTENDLQYSTFRGCDVSGIDYTMNICISNASDSFSVNAVWRQLNMESNTSRVQSAIHCLYGYIRYCVKDTLPMNLIYLSSPSKDVGLVDELALTCDKLLTLLRYWQDRVTECSAIMSHAMNTHMERLLIALCRCDFASSFALVPPLAWGKMDIFEEVNKQPTIGDLQAGAGGAAAGRTERRIKKQIPIPIDTLQDMDVLEQFLYRVNLIGWSSKKGFEEIWMSLLAALQGNGTHWAVRGVMQLILSTCYTVGGCCSRPDTTRMLHGLPPHDIRKLKSVALECDTYNILFSETDKEMYTCTDELYNYSTYSIEYLLHAAGVNDNPDVRTQNKLKEVRKNIEELGIDIESCLQLLMDIASQAFLPECDWGVGGRCSLLCCMVGVSASFSRVDQWTWLEGMLQLASSSVDHRDLLAQHHLQLGTAMVKAVLQKMYVDSGLVRCSFPPSGQAQGRTAPLHSILSHLRLYRDLYSKHIHATSILPPSTMQSLSAHLEGAMHDSHTHRLSLYERSIQWQMVMMLIDLGHETMLTAAANFLLANPTHPCFNQLIKGVCWSIIQHRYTLSVKDAFFKMITKHPHLCHTYLPLLMTLIYTEVSPPVEGVLEPEQLLLSLERASLLQSAALYCAPHHASHLLTLLSSYMHHYLTPHAIIHKITIEFIQCCRWSDLCNVNRRAGVSDSQLGLHLTPYYAEMMAEVVYKVFETSIAENQLSILSGWLFDVLEHILVGKISQETLGLPLLCLIISSSDNPLVRHLAPAAFHTMREGFHNKLNDNLKPFTTSYITFGSTVSNRMGTFDNKQVVVGNKLNFADRRLLCLCVTHSGFTDLQKSKLKELCSGNNALNDLLICL